MTPDLHHRECQWIVERACAAECGDGRITSRELVIERCPDLNLADRFPCVSPHRERVGGAWVGPHLVERERSRILSQRIAQDHYGERVARIAGAIRRPPETGDRGAA